LNNRFSDMIIQFNCEVLLSVVVGKQIR
jgi:hypothetical protein